MIAVAGVTDQVAHAAVANRGAEIMIMRNGPIGHIAAVRAAHDSHARTINAAVFAHVCDDRLHIHPIFCAPLAANGRGVFHAVALRAARIGKPNFISLRAQQLKLMKERHAVLRVRTAVHF